MNSMASQFRKPGGPMGSHISLFMQHANRNGCTRIIKLVANPQNYILAPFKTRLADHIPLLFSISNFRRRSEYTPTT